RRSSDLAQLVNSATCRTIQRSRYLRPGKRPQRTEIRSREAQGQADLPALPAQGLREGASGIQAVQRLAAFFWRVPDPEALYTHRRRGGDRSRAARARNP